MAACERVPANTRRFGLHEGIPLRTNAERLQNFVNFRGNLCLKFFNVCIFFALYRKWTYTDASNFFIMLQGTNEILRMFVALSSLQYAGAHLQGRLR